MSRPNHVVSKTLFVDGTCVFGYPSRTNEKPIRRVWADTKQWGVLLPYVASLTNGKAEIQRVERTMFLAANPAPNQRLVEIELMTDQASLASLSSVFRNQGSMMVCHRCDDVSELIAGIILDNESEEAWVLCGPCLREIPLDRTLAS